ncbi:MAG: 16S rRNA (uracil(1498)-N(3))-methyltransferase [Alphaproteobacteria bacterium]|nr:16S rRNA (uracil(1498)-N(3))-methyltransferase [Alphaproteobacteria bacterium]
MQIRLFIDRDLTVGATVPLTEAQAHYLRNVLRAEPGTELFVFDGKSGEFAAVLSVLNKKNGQIQICRLLREQPKKQDVRLYFSPLKRDCTEWVVEKATELGVTRIVPVITEYTSVKHVNTERLRLIAIEACEQCRRLDVPEISEPVALKELLIAQNDAEPLLIHLDETGRGQKASVVFSGIESAAFLVGPEGGFSETERALIAETPHTAGMDLGERILRAETAAVSALALFMCR